MHKSLAATAALALGTSLGPPTSAAVFLYSHQEHVTAFNNSVTDPQYTGAAEYSLTIHPASGADSSLDTIFGRVSVGVGDVGATYASDDRAVYQPTLRRLGNGVTDAAVTSGLTMRVNGGGFTPGVIRKVNESQFFFGNGSPRPDLAPAEVTRVRLRVDSVVFQPHQYDVTMTLTYEGTPVAGVYEWPVAEGGNGHWYEYVPAAGLTWQQARDAAAARTFLGSHGNLATFGSDGERNFAWQQPDFYTTTQYAWIGGSHAEGQADPRAGWSWVTGEDFDYAPWAPGEPNADGSAPLEPQYLTLKFYGDSAGFADHADLTTADRADMGGYFVEYVVPEPAAGLALFAAGALTFTRRRRRA